MPARMLPDTINCLTTSDLDVPIATSDPIPEQQSSPQSASSPHEKTAKSPRRRRRAATTTPKVPRLGNNRFIDTFRDALSDGGLPPPKYSKFKFNHQEPEELPQPPDPESEPERESLPRASLSPPPELVAKIPPWFRDVNGLRYAYPPQHPEDPGWFQRMFDCVMLGHTSTQTLLDGFRKDLKNVLGEMTLAEIDADESLAMYQEVLQDIQKVAGTKLVQKIADVSGCWHVEETSEGVEVQYDPEKGEHVRKVNRSASRRNVPQTGLAADIREIDRLDVCETPRGDEPTSPAPESPSHAPSIRAQKRRKERHFAPPPKRHRVFPPLPSSPPAIQARDSTLPPSSPIQSLPSSSSPGQNANSDPVALPEPAPVTETASLASLNLELNFKPSSSNFVSSQPAPGDSSAAAADPPASGDPVDPDPNSDPNPDPEPAPVPESPKYPSAYYNWRFPKEKSIPWNPPSTIPRRPSEDDIKMAWSPSPSPSKKRARADGEEDDGDSGIIVPKRTASNAESPFRAADESVEVAESVSAAIGAAHRAAAKARKKAHKPTKEEIEEREYMAHLRARLQERYVPCDG